MTQPRILLGSLASLRSAYLVLRLIPRAAQVPAFGRVLATTAISGGGSGGRRPPSTVPAVRPRLGPHMVPAAALPSRRAPLVAAVLTEIYPCGVGS
jgi:hypothetical protein